MQFDVTFVVVVAVVPQCVRCMPKSQHENGTCLIPIESDFFSFNFLSLSQSNTLTQCAAAEMKEERKIGVPDTQTCQKNKGNEQPIESMLRQRNEIIILVDI